MKTLNQLIYNYTSYLQHGEIQLAYKGIMEFISKLRVDFTKKYPQYDISGIYHGYMDMSYFSVSTDTLKDNGLKIAIVYLHAKGHFEAWLSARNREVSKKYKVVLDGMIIDGIEVFHDDTNQDAILECTLISAPDFEEQAMLIDNIEQKVECFVKAVSNLFIS